MSSSRARARALPHPKVLVLHQFRTIDYRAQEVLAIGATEGTDGKLWYRLSLPMRPNNTTGWSQRATSSCTTS